jgi:hypothetical protein
VSGEAGAYRPLRPDSISGYQVNVLNRLLPIPDPLDDGVNLGAYIIVAPKVVTFQAYGVDPITGRSIASNVIKLKVDVPPVLSGVSYSNSLEIPHGFRFVSDEFNIGTGIGIPNFITINPLATGINQFNIQLNL